MKTKTLQEQYNLIKEGKGNKETFLKEAKLQFPHLVRNAADFNETTTILKQRSVISENILQLGLVTQNKQPDWFSIFKENIDTLKEDNDPMVNPSFIIKSIPNNIDDKLKAKLKIGQQVKIVKKWKNATGSNEFLYGLDIEPSIGLTAFEIDQLKDTKESEKQAQDKARSGDSTQAALQGIGLFEAKEAKAIEKETTKEVTDMATRGYDYKDKKNTDNVYGGQFLNGFYTEMQNPKNADKTIEELKAIVTKNLTKDRLYYTTQTQFGIEGIGYTDQIPGYKPSKELKGKYKSSGYGDLDIDTEKIKANTKDTLGNKEAKTKMPSGVKEMPVTPKTVKGVKKMDMPGVEKKIKLKEGINLQEYGEDSGGQDMTYGMYRDKPGKLKGTNQDFVDKGKEDYYDGVPFESCPYENGFNKYYKADLAKLWQMGWKEAKAEDQLPPTADKDIPFQGMTEESKVNKSLKKKVKKIIEKILNKETVISERSKEEIDTEKKDVGDEIKNKEDRLKQVQAAIATLKTRQGTLNSEKPTDVGK